MPNSLIYCPVRNGGSAEAHADRHQVDVAGDDVGQRRRRTR